MKGFLASCICAVNVALRVTYGAQAVMRSRIYIVQGQVNNSATKSLQWLDTSTMLKVSEAKWEEESPDESMAELHSSACTPYDSQSTSFFCFGGMNPSQVGHRADASSLTFNVETRQWRQVNLLTMLHPTPRYGHAMITIPDLGIGLLGGAEVAGSSISNEFWLLNPMNYWIKAATHGLPPSYRHTLSVINTGLFTKLISIGGKLTSSKLISTKFVQVYNVALKSWASREVRFPIQERHSHSAAVWGKYIVIYGGANWDNSEVYSDICSLDTETMEWATLSLGEGKPGRYGHNAAIIGNHMYITFGKSLVPTEDILVFDLKSKQFIQERVSPEPQNNAGWFKFWMLLAVIGLVILVLGVICFFFSRRQDACKGELNSSEETPEYQFPDYGIVELSIDSGLDQFSSFSNNSANKNVGVPSFTNTSSAQGLGTGTGST